MKRSKTWMPEFFLQIHTYSYLRAETRAVKNKWVSSDHSSSVVLKRMKFQNWYNVKMIQPWKSFNYYSSKGWLTLWKQKPDRYIAKHSTFSVDNLLEKFGDFIKTSVEEYYLSDITYSSIEKIFKALTRDNYKAIVHKCYRKIENTNHWRKKFIFYSEKWKNPGSQKFCHSLQHGSFLNWASLQETLIEKLKEDINFNNASNNIKLVSRHYESVNRFK